MIPPVTAQPRQLTDSCQWGWCELTVGVSHGTRGPLVSSKWDAVRLGRVWGGGCRQALPWSAGFSSAPPWRDRLDRGQERWRNIERQRGGEMRPSELPHPPPPTHPPNTFDKWPACWMHECTVRHVKRQKTKNKIGLNVSKMLVCPLTWWTDRRWK